MSIKPVINPTETLGNTLLLVDVNTIYERIKNTDGQFEKTDKISHYSYTVVCLERKFEKVLIKIDEQRPLFDTELSEVPDNTFVEFENLFITPYVSNGWIQLSTKADKCIVLEA